MNKSYSGKLKHPKWQRRRLEILQRDNFTCQLCGDTETTLNIHHKEYHKGDVWEYEDNELITYCELCHIIVEYFKEEYVGEDVILVEKSKSQDIPTILNIVVLIRKGGKYLIYIMYFDMELNKLFYVVSISKEIVNRLSSIVNEYSEMLSNG